MGACLARKRLPPRQVAPQVVQPAVERIDLAATATCKVPDQRLRCSANALPRLNSREQLPDGPRLYTECDVVKKSKPTVTVASAQPRGAAPKSKPPRRRLPDPD